MLFQSPKNKRNPKVEHNLNLLYMKWCACASSILQRNFYLIRFFDVKIGPMEYLIPSHIQVMHMSNSQIVHVAKSFIKSDSNTITYISKADYIRKVIKMMYILAHIKMIAKKKYSHFNWSILWSLLYRIHTQHTTIGKHRQKAKIERKITCFCYTGKKYASSIWY